MPTVFEINGYKFYFYSNENDEPVHIHVSKGGANAKYWLIPIAEVYSYGFNSRERKEIHGFVELNANKIINKWNEFFK